MNNAQQSADKADQSGRRRCAGLLAGATLTELEAAWNTLPEKPQTRAVRGPETGLIMVRGRIGGGGSAFNLGEATVTRATVALEGNIIGHAQSLGTDKEKVRLAAIFDALWQIDTSRDLVERSILTPVEERIEIDRKKKAEEAAATRVDFFTMVRGED